MINKAQTVIAVLNGVVALILLSVLISTSNGVSAVRAAFTGYSTSSYPVFVSNPFNAPVYTLPAGGIYKTDTRRYQDPCQMAQNAKIGNRVVQAGGVVFSAGQNVTSFGNPPTYQIACSFATSGVPVYSWVLYEQPPREPATRLW